MHEKGFALFELVIVMMVLLVFISATVNFSNQVFVRYEHQQYQESMLELLRFARLEAMLVGSPVTVSSIDGQWCHGAVAFKDSVETAVDQPKNELRRIAGVKAKDCHITWHSFQGQPFLRFLPVGSTAYQNGRFIDEGYWQIIVSKTGRARKL